MSNDPEFFTVNELAEMLKVTPKTIYRMTERGSLTCHKIGKSKRYSRADVDAFLERVRVTGKATS